MKTFLTLILAAFALLPASLQAQTQIQPGAAINITIQGVPVAESGRINAVYPVSKSGYINMWHIGQIRAAGLEPDALARQIETAYRNAEIYISPTIQVISNTDQSITQQMVTVGGKVRAPGPKPYTQGMTLYDAVMSAGPTEFGAINRVKLYRNGKAYVYDLNKGTHKLLKLHPRDTIDVPQKNWIGQ